MMAPAGDPNFVCPVWTPENGFPSYVVDPRSGATIARLVDLRIRYQHGTITVTINHNDVFV